MTPDSPPSTDRALLVRAFRAQQAGQFAEAEDAYAKYLLDHPNDVAALNNAGALALQAGRPALAVSRFEQLVAVHPDDAPARTNLGFVLIRALRPEAAIFHLERATQLDPRYAPAYNNLGIALERAGRRGEALHAFQRALEIEPRMADAAANMGDLLNKAGETARARAAFAQALAANPQQPTARLGLAFAQAQDGDLDGARAALEAQASPAPAFAPFWQVLGALRHWSGDLDGAEDAYRQASALAPDDFDAKFGIASTLLGRGDYERGWRAFEERPDGRYGPARRFPAMPVWSGARLDGPLLVFAEQGLGDVVQFARFLPEARKRVGGIVLVLDAYWRTLAPLLATMPGIDHLLKDAALVETLDRIPVARVSLLSLPYLLGVTPEGLPGPMPYLSAPADRAAIWRPRLDALPRPRVGLAWAAFARGDHAYLTRHKSVPLAALAPLIGRAGATFVSLQVGAGGDLAPLGELAGRVVDFTADIRDFGDTAAIIAELDLVISTDTSVAHAAGALDKPVWLLDRYNTCWRWRLAPGHSPWYPKLRIFRQHRFLDWSQALAAADAALAGFVADGTLPP